ncbi:adenosylcobinamide kinase/adenosylcobinamide phosphate guanyltransferase [Prochlorococcus marinus str. MU1404]|uniref:bifunctional adenosylcobinamide kinase/adenosylcobinamide-phosphate guanylyltransferase n=1 Tax=Prochlorococcus marinus TaxID=1219 RepID=UPI001ADBD02D|nr:bifunctional adenosylcobinamide kinase/adenosylcobinamide-phosphate guanylyltransferase [Prochlorococcus marinus]MBO8230027.1 adenosylcobinamide kinase/adenosylcobinamide-phosphate guanylyltransferase [Prochlorococcus marinus XMU1404]MBW3073199.1 adenosylcobinamide kinase/adenosylcobinamide phosphate guanyltransferase [Prochlorococcus marinus str. MU1404]MCR8545636.1 bifunctional adenosylcobinamide kinase/adenosylcobinamide-phosphate guanylyltransferase [Prochlorococcus marinus CUG1432]
MNANNSSLTNDLSHIIFITGGTKSGKSEFAEHLAKKTKKLSYIALSEINIEDKEWQEKINLHKKRRPKDWKLIETRNLLNILCEEEGPLLIDSIGGFVMESINKEQEEWSTKLDSLISLLIKRKSITFIVGEQVGWSLVSEYKIGNTYIERIGELQKRITKISKDNWLAINGRAIKIDEISLEIPT